MLRESRTMHRISTCYFSFAMKTEAKTLAAIRKDNEVLKPFKDIPAPLSLPFLKQSHHYWPGGMFYNLNGNDLWNKIYENYGPVILGESWTPIRRELALLDYYRRHYKKTEPPIAVGLGTEQGDDWRKYRMMANKILMKPKVVQAYSDTLHFIALDMIKRIKVRRDAQSRMPEDFDQDLKLWALESVASISLERRLGCLNLNLVENSPELSLIRCVDDAFMYFDKLDHELSPWTYISTKTYKKAMENFEKLESLVEYFKQKSMKESRMNVTNKINKSISVLEQLMDIHEYFARVMVADMFIAGVDTTSTTMLRTLYMLAKHSDKQEILRDAVMNKQDKRYLKACIKETLRIMPLNSVLHREATKPYNLLGYEIPTGTEITFSYQYLSMLEKNYSEPEKFIPERWTVEANHPLYYGNAHPYAYGPFGLGVRSCVGRRVANLELETLLEEIIKNFRIEWHGPPPIITGFTVNVTNGPFKFVFKDL